MSIGKHSLLPEELKLREILARLGSAAWYDHDGRADWFVIFRCKTCVLESRKHTEIGLAGQAMTHYDRTRNRTDRLVSAGAKLKCGLHDGANLILVKRVVVTSQTHEHEIPQAQWERWGPGGRGELSEHDLGILEMLAIQKRGC